MQQRPLTKRQNLILQTIEELEQAGNQQIIEKVAASFDQVSRITIVRDLNALLAKNLIKKSGKGRSIVYLSNIPVLEKNFDLDQYFAKEPDERSIKKTKLNFHGSEQSWAKILTFKELTAVRNLTSQHQESLSRYNPIQTTKELERITIEFSWKSSRIEGNTYTLLDTERRIKEDLEAKGKTHDEAVMILNHKKALEYAWAHPGHFSSITLAKIEDIHALISADLGIEKGIRKRPVGIIGTAYKPFDNIFQIKESVQSLCALVNAVKEPFLKALIAVAGISYIQPFEDGNKRTSRLMANALLIANNYCPLSYRSVDELHYKKAIILFYEQHSLTPFKKLFLEQYKFAVTNYFRL